MVHTNGAHGRTLQQNRKLTQSNGNPQRAQSQADHPLSSQDRKRRADAAERPEGQHKRSKRLEPTPPKRAAPIARAAPHKPLASVALPPGKEDVADKKAAAPGANARLDALARPTDAARAREAAVVIRGAEKEDRGRKQFERAALGEVEMEREQKKTLERKMRKEREAKEAARATKEVKEVKEAKAAKEKKEKVAKLKKASTPKVAKAPRAEFDANLARILSYAQPTPGDKALQAEREEAAHRPKPLAIPGDDNSALPASGNPLARKGKLKLRN
ncbi:hypothetical protein HDZ31DRAFT_64918 [Schizophyllum fasciatum]